MHVLVTGAAGFVGSHLAEALVSRGDWVRGIDAFTTFYDPGRKEQNLTALLDQPRFELVRADLLDADLDSALDDIDVVVNLAGEPGVTTSWGPSFAGYLERNVLATQRLIEACVQRPVRRLVHASSSSVYGVDAGTLAARGEPRPASPYGVSKLAGEALVGAYARNFGLPSISLRYFSVYGPRQRPDMAAHRFVEALLDGHPLVVYGDGTQVRDFTYVADVVEATILATSADVPAGAVLDVASGRPVDVRTVIATLHRVAGTAEPSVDLRGERPGDVPRTAGQIALTRACLGWTPRTDLATGLANQVAWHRARRGAGGPALDPVPAVAAAAAPPAGGAS